MWPHSLRNRLIVLMLVVIALPTLVSGFLMTVSAEKALIEEKQRKLFGAARILESQLDGTFDDILEKNGAHDATKVEKIRILNKELQPITDIVADAYPGIGVGYYVKDLDIQATYGPSRLYASQVGLSISPDHEGRLVMGEGKPRVQVGDLMRGSIMNAMFPIIRDGVTIGYIYSNELTSDVDAQVGIMKQSMYVIMLIGLFVGIVGIFSLVDRLTTDIKGITDGLTNLKRGFRNQIPDMSGEMGTIATAINDMGQELLWIKQLEEQLQQAERLSLVGAIAAGLAHDIRNPLMSIRGFAQLLRESSKQKEQTEYSDIIIKETARMDRLIEQLLRFSRPTETEITQVNVKDVLESTVRLINTKPTLGQIEFLHDAEDGLPWVLADEEHLHQVLLNILINAIQASANGEGRVHMRSFFDSVRNAVLITIADNGPGIPPENLSRVFNLFFTTKSQGTGLGLSVAHRLVKSWGGDIEVESAPDGGTIFTVVLLVAEGDNADGK